MKRKRKSCKGCLAESTTRPRPYASCRVCKRNPQCVKVRDNYRGW